MANKVLGIGFSGLLGSHMKLDCDRPSHKELDITGIIIPKNYDCIVLAAAYTRVAEAETDKWNCFNVNVNGVMNVLEAYPKTPLIYISSEYAKNPVNFYSLTKSLAEQLVTQHTAPYLIIRLLFKPDVWPYDNAFIDSYTGGDIVSIMAPLMDKAIMEWNRKESKMIHLQTGRKTIWDIAAKSKPNIRKSSVKEITNVRIPIDYE